LSAGPFDFVKRVLEPDEGFLSLALTPFSAARRGGDALGVVCRVSVVRVIFAGFNFLN
jgi:hypothetical protein